MIAAEDDPKGRMSRQQQLQLQEQIARGTMTVDYSGSKSRVESAKARKRADKIAAKKLRKAS